jgi:hypothetical protein
VQLVVVEQDELRSGVALDVDGPGVDLGVVASPNTANPAATSTATMTPVNVVSEIRRRGASGTSGSPATSAASARRVRNLYAWS